MSRKKRDKKTIIQICIKFSQTWDANQQQKLHKFRADSNENKLSIINGHIWIRSRKLWNAKFTFYSMKIKVFIAFQGFASFLTVTAMVRSLSLNVEGFFDQSESSMASWVTLELTRGGLEIFLWEFFVFSYWWNICVLGISSWVS